MLVLLVFLVVPVVFCKAGQVGLLHLEKLHSTVSWAARLTSE